MEQNYFFQKIFKQGLKLIILCFITISHFEYLLQTNLMVYHNHNIKNTNTLYVYMYTCANM